MKLERPVLSCRARMSAATPVPIGSPIQWAVNNLKVERYPADWACRAANPQQADVRFGRFLSFTTTVAANGADCLRRTGRSARNRISVACSISSVAVTARPLPPEDGGCSWRAEVNKLWRHSKVSASRASRQASRGC